MQEGDIVFYIDHSMVYSGRVMDIEKKEVGFLFSIDSYGGCEGHYRIASSQIGRSVFFSEEDAIKRAQDGGGV